MDRIKTFVGKYQEHFIFYIQLVLCLLFAVHAARGSISKSNGKKKQGKKNR